MRRATLLLPLAALASCVPPPRPVAPPPIPQPAPTPAPTPAAALGPDWNDWPRTPGTWRYAAGPSGSSATFGGTTPLATLACDPRSRSATLTLAAGGSGPVTIRTSSATRQVAPATAGGTALSATTLALPTNDPLLDAIAYSRGRFTIEQAGAAPLVLPPYAEVDRVIEDCRG